MQTMMERALPGVGGPLRVFPSTNMERMYALDEAWNARDWDTFDAYHDPDRVVVYWPERQSMPTRGGPDHRAVAERFRWHMGKIVEEYLFYDSATFMKQIGLD